MNGLRIRHYVTLRVNLFNTTGIMILRVELQFLLAKSIILGLQRFVLNHSLNIYIIFYKLFIIFNIINIQPSPTIGQSAPVQSRVSTITKTDTNEDSSQHKLYTAASLIDAIITSQIHQTIAITKPTNTPANNSTNSIIRQTPKTGLLIIIS